MNNNLTPYDIKKTLKRGLIYLAIAFPFVLAVATALTIINAPLWAIMLCNVTVGGLVVLVEMVIYKKHTENKKKKHGANSDFDPFKD